MANELSPNIAKLQKVEHLVTNYAASVEKFTACKNRYVILEYNWKGDADIVSYDKTAFGLFKLLLHVLFSPSSFFTLKQVFGEDQIKQALNMRKNKIKDITAQSFKEVADTGSEELVKYQATILKIDESFRKTLEQQISQPDLKLELNTELNELKKKLDVAVATTELAVIEKSLTDPSPEIRNQTAVPLAQYLVDKKAVLPQETQRNAFFKLLPVLKSIQQVGSQNDKAQIASIKSNLEKLDFVKAPSLFSDFLAKIEGLTTFDGELDYYVLVATHAKELPPHILKNSQLGFISLLPSLQNSLLTMWGSQVDSSRQTAESSADLKFVSDQRKKLANIQEKLQATQSLIPQDLKPEDKGSLNEQIESTHSWVQQTLAKVNEREKTLIDKHQALTEYRTSFLHTELSKKPEVIGKWLTAIKSTEQLTSKDFVRRHQAEVNRQLTELIQEEQELTDLSALKEAYEAHRKLEQTHQLPNTGSESMKSRVQALVKERHENQIKQLQQAITDKEKALKEVTGTLIERRQQRRKEEEALAKCMTALETAEKALKSVQRESAIIQLIKNSIMYAQTLPTLSQQQRETKMQNLIEQLLRGKFIKEGAETLIAETLTKDNFIKSLQQVTNLAIKKVGTARKEPQTLEDKMREEIAKLKTIDATPDLELQKKLEFAWKAGLSKGFTKKIEILEAKKKALSEDSQGMMEYVTGLINELTTNLTSADQIAVLEKEIKQATKDLKSLELDWPTKVLPHLQKMLTSLSQGSNFNDTDRSQCFLPLQVKLQQAFKKELSTLSALQGAAKTTYTQALETVDKIDLQKAQETACKQLTDYVDKAKDRSEEELLKEQTSLSEAEKELNVFIHAQKKRERLDKPYATMNSSLYTFLAIRDPFNYDKTVSACKETEQIISKTMREKQKLEKELKNVQNIQIPNNPSELTPELLRL